MRRLVFRDEGNALIVVIIVSMIIGILGAVALDTGREAQFSATSDGDRQQALGAAEAGLHLIMSRVSAEAGNATQQGVTLPNFWSIAPGGTLPAGCAPGGTCAAAKNSSDYTGSTPQGTYWYWVTRCTPSTIPCPGTQAEPTAGFIVDVQASSGGTVFGRGRHIQVTLTPPSRFAHDEAYALFSYTSINVSNNDQVLKGDVFANTNVMVNNSNQNPTVQGSLTSATGWIELDSSVHVTGNVWSGGFNPTGSTTGWSLNLGNAARIDGSAKASTSNNNDCAALPNHNYDVILGSGATVGGGITTLGSVTPSGSGTTSCTQAQPALPLPLYTFNPDFYDPATYHGPWTVADFQTWLSSNLSNLHGTFNVTSEPLPFNSNGQTNRIDLSGAKLTGSTTIVTNAPVYTGSLDDSQMTDPNGTFVIVSHYQAPPSTACSTTSNTSECAIHITNGFSLNTDGTCRTATLLYADNGPVALKNSSNGGGNLCGSIISNGIVVKNNENVTYDSRIDRVVGFGPSAYAITRWEELAATK